VIPYLYHNLGLGDHFICNAIVRHYEKENGLIHLFAKRHNEFSVKAMFKDVDVNVILVQNDQEVEEILKRSPGHKVFRIGCTGEGWTTAGPETYEELFYKQAGIPFEMKWSGFKYEIDLFPYSHKFNPPEYPYKFIHHDIGRGMKIRDEYFKSDIPVLQPYPWLSANILMWGKILAQAEEIHCIESCFMFFADLIPTKGKLFVHRYARKITPFEMPKMKKKWTIINE
jgi:hypothetical protein